MNRKESTMEMREKIYCELYRKNITEKECEEVLAGERKEDLAGDALPYLGDMEKDVAAIWECKNCKRYQAYRNGDCMKGIGDPMDIRLNKAIEFSVGKHAGQRRKGSSLPYIVHPLETMQILLSMDADCSLLMAGVLHDVVEDTDTTIEMLKELFGEEVAELVGGHSEDKSKSWKERKEKDIEDTEKGAPRLQMLVMADKVSNLRSLYMDYQKIGEELWERFHAPKEKQAWYYSKMIDALEQMQYNNKTSKIYWEMVGLFKDVFVKFYYSSFREEIYQICADGINYILDSRQPKWDILDGKMTEDVEEIPRKQAEWIEDRWAECFYNQVAMDMQDGEYELFTSPGRELTMTLRDRCITLRGCDMGTECEYMSGKDSYEFVYELEEEQTYKLFTILRARYVSGCKMDEILKREFGHEDGSVRFENYCRAEGVEFQFWAL